MCGLGCLCRIPALAQTYLCWDNSVIGRHSFKRGICLTVQSTINPFLIYEYVSYLGFSIIYVGVGPYISHPFLEIRIKAG